MTMRLLRSISSLSAVAAVALTLATCAPELGQLAQIRKLGTLRVAMTNSVTTYYSRGDRAAGFEYDLAGRFAQDLGLHLTVVPVRTNRDAIEAVRSGRADMAAGLAVSRSRRQQVRFTPIYVRIDLEAVYHVDTAQPQDMRDLSGALAIPSHSALSHALAQQYPHLQFTLPDNSNAEAIMARIARQELHSTIASADLVAMYQRYHPELRKAFTVPDIERRLAWAFRKTDSDGIYNKAIAWLEQARAAGLIRNLRQRYFAHAQRLGFVGGQIFARQVEERLPQWRAIFKQVGTEYGLDWRLLAAVSYQESHWDPAATSPTGVRGLMMLTEDTAAELDVDNRLDPQQSISGGAQYLVNLRARLPASIEEPDRTWLTLAAYNIGFGHLMDARRLLEMRDRDPDQWINVREALTWLTRKSFLDDTAYGYAPGYQAVEYVGNIRAYQDILDWMSGDREGEKPAALADDNDDRDGETASDSEGDNADGEDEPITIDSPAL